MADVARVADATGTMGTDPFQQILPGGKGEQHGETVTRSESCNRSETEVSGDSVPGTAPVVPDTEETKEREGKLKSNGDHDDDEEEDNEENEEETSEESDEGEEDTTKNATVTHVVSETGKKKVSKGKRKEKESSDDSDSDDREDKDGTGDENSSGDEEGASNNASATSSSRRTVVSGVSTQYGGKTLRDPALHDRL